MKNLADLSDPTKLANPASITGLTASPSTMANKFSDMGCGFSDVSKVSSTLGALSKPSVPSLDSYAPSLKSLMSSHQSAIQSMTGTGTGPMGVPSITDFTHAVSGGPEINAIANGASDTDSLTALNTSLAKSNSLFTTAGIDFTTPPSNNLSTSMNFATNLHKYGADTSGSGIGDVLSGIAVPNSPFGDSIKNSLAEGQNMSALQNIGVSPLTFSNLPSAGDENSLGGGATLLGG